MADQYAEEETEDAWDSEIKGRVRLFVLNYCTETLCFFNGRESYRAAYTKIKKGKEVYTPSDEVCDASASRLLSNVKVRRACGILLKELQPEVNTDGAYRILHAAKVIATTSPADIIDKNGKLVVKTLKELGDRAYCIAQVYHDKSGHLCYQLEDRGRYIGLLAKVYKLEAMGDEQKKDDIGVVELPQKVSEGSTPQETADKWNGQQEKQDTVQ